MHLEPNQDITRMPDSVIPAQHDMPIKPSSEIPATQPPLPDQETHAPQPPQSSLFWKRKPKSPKRRLLIKKRPKKHPTAPDAQEDLQEPLKATFTLRLNDEGNLIGLPIKQQRPKKEKSDKKRFKLSLKLPLRRSKKEEKDEGEEESEQSTSKFSKITALPKKVTGVVSRLKPGKSGGESSENPIKRSIGKLKKIFSRSS